MRLGVCWYPEQWPERDWSDDVARMADLGLELVRIGEFAWARMEPSRDRWDLGWLDRAVSAISDAGMQVVLGTPTATPPVWLTRERPEMLRVRPDGRRFQPGSRRHTCPTSAAAREEAARVVAVLAARYGALAEVAAWQVDNEPGNHDSARCWCGECHAAFRRWLEHRHGTIEALNQAWGQQFWSMTYPDFSAVDVPVKTVTAHNPSLEVAHRRFASDQVVAGLAEQVAVIREHDPSAVTFTNLYMGDLDVDAQAVHRLHGLGAIDSYPHGLTGPTEVAHNLALAMGAALQPGEGADGRGGRAWVVEQQPGPVNWTGDNPAVPPGQVRDWILQAADLGVEALLVFRWRMARAGQEQHHAAVLAHDRRELPAAGEIRQAVALLGGDRAPRPPATAALVSDYGDAWMLSVVPQTDGASHRQLAVAAYGALVAAGHVVDVVPADADLGSYPLVVAPGLHQVSETRTAALRAAVAGGTTVVLGPRSLVRDADAVWVDVPLPAGFADELGAVMATGGSPDGWPRGAEPPATATIGDRDDVPVGAWADVLAPLPGSGAVPEVLGTVRSGPLSGRVIAARSGRLVWLGASSQAAWEALLGAISAER